jgi:GGDEF domain-containing protein
MVDNIGSTPDCEVAARHLLDVFERPFQAGTVRATIGASIGAAIAPASGSSAGDLLNAADRAMYRAKRIGGNAFKIAPVLADAMRPKARTR